jgi:hypothetical protein
MALNSVTRYLSASVIAIPCIFAAQEACAERPLQERSQAAFVVEGRVLVATAVRAGHMEHYSTQIKVTKVMKGRVEVGDVFTVTSFRMVDSPPFGWVGSTGHQAPPTEGEYLIAYATDRIVRDGYEGIYKNWFDIRLPAQN